MSKIPALSLKAFMVSVILLSVMTGCKDDDKTPEPLDAKVYSGLNNIEVTYNGTDMAGKRGEYITAGYGVEAKLLMSSEFNLKELSEDLSDIPPIPAPGVLPGSPVLELTPEFIADGNRYKFSGEGTTDYVTYRYSGNIDADKLAVYFTDVKLKNQTFANSAWKPMPKSGETIDDTQPIRLIWETQLPIEIPQLEAGIQDALRILVNVPFIPVYNNTATMSLTQVITNGLRTIGFNDDGNMPVTYLKTANGSSVFTLAPKCTFQYIALSDSDILLYVNPTDILSLILLNSGKHDPDIPENPFGIQTRSDDISPLLPYLLNIYMMVKPMIAAGFPMHAERSGDELHLYIGKEVLLPLLQNGIIPLIQSSAFRDMVTEYITSNPELQEYELEIMGLLDLLPLVFEQTTNIEIGLNLVKNQE